MSQLTFNLQPDRRSLSVSELTARIRDLLAKNFTDILVEGEISNCRAAQSGHFYFTLKDEKAQVRCVWFKQQMRGVKIRPEDGLKVSVRGSISVYEARGEYQIYVESLEPVGTDTDLSASVREFVRRRQRTGLSVVVSDLFAPSGYERGLDQLRHRRYEPNVVQIHDPKEARPDMLGDVELYDIENASSRKVTVTERALRMYRRLFDDHQRSVARYCRNYGLGCTQATTEIQFDDLILRMMRVAGAVA